MLRDIQGKVLEAASVGKQQGIQLGKKQEVLTFLWWGHQDITQVICPAAWKRLASFTEIPFKSHQEFRAQKKSKTRPLEQKMLIKSSWSAAIQSFVFYFTRSKYWCLTCALQMALRKTAAPVCEKREQGIKIASLLHNFPATEVQKLSTSIHLSPTFISGWYPERKIISHLTAQPIIVPILHAGSERGLCRDFT